MPGPLGLASPPGHLIRDGDAFTDLLRLQPNPSSQSHTPVPPLSDHQISDLLDEIGGRSEPPKRGLLLATALTGDVVGDSPTPPPGAPVKPPDKPDQALLDAALKAGIKVMGYRKGEPKNTPGIDLKLPGGAAVIGAAAVVPILPSPASLPGTPTPGGPLNLPGPFRPNAFAPGTFIEPPPATAPGAGGAPARAVLPGAGAAVAAGSVVFFFGSLIPSDSGIKKIDKTRTWELIDRFARFVREAEEKLNNMTFHGDWSYVKNMNPNRWKRIAELRTKQPWVAFSLLKMAFGFTIEEMVAGRIMGDAEMDDAIDRVGGGGKPDFRGSPIGPLDEFSLEITTLDDLDPHLARKDNPEYGKYLLVFTYERWFNDSLK
jgi:hypothetical protein